MALAIFFLLAEIGASDELPHECRRLSGRGRPLDKLGEYAVVT
jgi:hypothetical protein